MARRSARLGLKAELKSANEVAEASDVQLEVAATPCDAGPAIKKSRRRDDSSEPPSSPGQDAFEEPPASRKSRVRRPARPRAEPTAISHPDVLELIMSFIALPAALGRLSVTCKAAQASFAAFAEASPHLCLALTGGERLLGLPVPVKRALAILIGRKCELCECAPGCDRCCCCVTSTILPPPPASTAGGKGNVKGLKPEFRVWAHDACVKRELVNAYRLSAADRALLTAAHAPCLVTEGWNPHSHPHEYTMTEYWLGGAPAPNAALPAAAAPAASTASASLLNASETVAGVRALGSVEAARNAGRQRVTAWNAALAAATAAEAHAEAARVIADDSADAKRALRKPRKSAASQAVTAPPLRPALLPSIPLHPRAPHAPVWVAPRVPPPQPRAPIPVPRAPVPHAPVPLAAQRGHGCRGISQSRPCRNPPKMRCAHGCCGGCCPGPCVPHKRSAPPVESKFAAALNGWSAVGASAMVVEADNVPSGVALSGAAAVAEVLPEAQAVPVAVADVLPEDQAVPALSRALMSPFVAAVALSVVAMADSEALDASMEAPLASTDAPAAPAAADNLPAPASLLPAPPALPPFCVSCHVATGLHECFGCAILAPRQDAAPPAVWCDTCITFGRCVPSCHDRHPLCPTHAGATPLGGYPRRGWVAAHDLDSESGEDCECGDTSVRGHGRRGASREISEAEAEMNRSGCAVCDGTGHIKCGKGGYRDSTFLGAIAGVQE